MYGLSDGCIYSMICFWLVALNWVLANEVDPVTLELEEAVRCGLAVAVEVKAFGTDFGPCLPALGEEAKMF